MNTKAALSNADIVLGWINRVSPLALIAGLIYATIWANNLTHMITVESSAVAAHVTQAAHSGAENRITKLEGKTDSIKSDVATHLEYIRGDLEEIRKILSRRADNGAK